MDMKQRVRAICSPVWGDPYPEDIESISSMHTIHPIVIAHGVVVEPANLSPADIKLLAEDKGFAGIVLTTYRGNPCLGVIEEV